MFKSIGAKLQFMIACAFLVTGVGTVTIIFCQTGSLSKFVSNTVKEDQNAIYALKLDDILRGVNDTYASLNTTIEELGLAGTDMATEYTVDSKKEALSKITDRFYSDQNKDFAEKEIYPFVIDKSGVVVLHPKLDAGTNVADQTYAKALVEGQEFSTYEADGQSNFLFSRTMPEWGWIISFSVPEKVILAPVEGVKASVKTLKTTISLFVCTIAVLSVVLLGFAVSRKITRPLHKIIAQLTTGSDLVASASNQISSASQSLAQGATEQAAGLEETSSSLEEMSSMTKQNADNAQQANILSDETSTSANDGAQSMGRMSSAIEEIRKSSDETAKIIKVIDEIAFQTNLLALNAAVEAARAGEAGKGFAVVAEEVRNLAIRSAEAAKNTSSLIEESVRNSQNGVEISNEVGKVFEDIVGKIEKTSNLVGEIAAASVEQAQGIDQVNTAVGQMDKVTQQNAANAEESASASQELSTQAEQMNLVVQRLAALVNGGKVVPNQSKVNKVSSSDELYHQIAQKPAATAQTSVAKSSDGFEDFDF